MKVEVDEKEVVITEIDQVFEGEYGVNECEFSLPECFEGLSVTAVFNEIPIPVVRSKCYIPSLKKGDCTLGVYAFKEENGETEIMYSPKPTVFSVFPGSFSETTGEEVVPLIGEIDLYFERLRDYWAELIESNTLARYTENANEKQYYSAKVLNDFYHSLKGDLDDVSALVGGAE